MTVVVGVVIPTRRQQSMSMNIRSLDAHTSSVDPTQVTATATYCVDLLRRLKTNPEQISPEDWLQHVLQPANHGNRVEIIEEAKVRDAEELSLHLALTICDHARELLFESLYDRSRIGTRRCVHSSYRSCGSRWRKQLQPECLDRSP